MSGKCNVNSFFQKLATEGVELLKMTIAFNCEVIYLFIFYTIFQYTYTSKKLLIFIKIIMAWI